MIVPSDLQRAAIHAMRRAAARMRDSGATATDDEMVSFAQRDDIVDLPGFRALEARYAPGGTGRDVRGEK